MRAEKRRLHACHEWRQVGLIRPAPPDPLFGVEVEPTIRSQLSGETALCLNHTWTRIQMTHFDFEAVSARLKEQSKERRKTRTYAQRRSALDKHKFELLQLDHAGCNGSQLQLWLAEKGITVELSTVTRWLQRQLREGQTKQEGQTVEAIKSTVSKSKARKPGQPKAGKRLSEVSRLYSNEQIALIVAKQSPHNGLATEIARAAGLRAPELLTLQSIQHHAPDERPAHALKFVGILNETIGYTVCSKGGQFREVRIPIALARRLEATRLEEPISVTDRGVTYQQHYRLGGGQPWSKSFGAASQAALGWTKGAHGLRHCYAQERLRTVQRHLRFAEAMLVVSQELDHARPDRTKTYLR